MFDEEDLYLLVEETVNDKNFETEIETFKSIEQIKHQ